MRDRNKDLETKIALLTIEIDETEEKNKALETENIKLKDNIEDIYKEKRNMEFLS